jgi:hypothetical protein
VRITWGEVRTGDVMFHDRGHGSPLLVTRHLDWGYGTVIVDLHVLACYALLRDGEEVA